MSAVSDGKLYWSGDGKISSMNLDGNDRQTLISFSSRDFSDIIVVEDMLLLSDSITGYVTVVLFQPKQCFLLSRSAHIRTCSLGKTYKLVIPSNLFFSQVYSMKLPVNGNTNYTLTRITNTPLRGHPTGMAAFCGSYGMQAFAFQIILAPAGTSACKQYPACIIQTYDV